MATGTTTIISAPIRWVTRFWRDCLTEWDGIAIPDLTAVVQIIYGDANGGTNLRCGQPASSLGSDSIFDELRLARGRRALLDDIG